LEILLLASSFTNFRISSREKKEKRKKKTNASQCLTRASEKSLKNERQRALGVGGGGVFNHILKTLLLIFFFSVQLKLKMATPTLLRASEIFFKT
jgi:hypothetical protein